MWRAVSQPERVQERSHSASLGVGLKGTLHPSCVLDLENPRRGRLCSKGEGLLRTPSKGRFGMLGDPKTLWKGELKHSP